MKIDCNTITLKYSLNKWMYLKNVCIKWMNRLAFKILLLRKQSKITTVRQGTYSENKIDFFEQVPLILWIEMRQLINKFKKEEKLKESWNYTLL